MAQTLDIERILRGWDFNPAINRHRLNISVEDGMALACELGRRLHSDFIIDDGNRFVYENLVRWMFADPSAKANDAAGNEIPASLTKGLYISGPTGTGKTVCMKVFSYFAKALSISYDAGVKQQFLDFNFYRADLICDEYAREGDLQKFKQLPILNIEDLGSESKETLYMGNRRCVLQSILEARGDSMRQITNVTSNIPINVLYQDYGDRVQSRAFEMWNYYILNGDDRRR